MSELERAVMGEVWRRGRPVTGREVVEGFTRDRQYAYTTVLTIMDRLVRKGVLTKRLQGRAAVYEAVQTREAYTAALMTEALDLAGDAKAVLLHFVDRLPAQHEQDLRDALMTGERPGHPGIDTGSSS